MDTLSPDIYYSTFYLLLVTIRFYRTPHIVESAIICKELDTLIANIYPLEHISFLFADCSFLTA